MSGIVKYRPSKSFLVAIGGMVPLGIALYFGLLPELGAIGNSPVPGEITFRSARPSPGSSPANPDTRSRSSRWSMDWLTERYEDLMAWERNPWKTQKTIFGSHYLKLQGSKNPFDQAKVKEIKRLGEALLQRVLQRYPELAVTYKNLLPGQNGFLKWLELSERLGAGASHNGGAGKSDLDFPDALKKHLSEGAPWNADAAREWLTREKALLDEIRAIGLMPEQSVGGIDIHRWAFISARLGKNCAEALLLDARLSAEDGNVAAALESIQAAKGLADHFGNIETPSLLAVTVQILIQMQVQAYVLSEVMPALPAGQMDPATWERVLNPTVHPPSEFARIMRGEWHVSAREYLMPMLSNAEDPKYPSDPDAIIDFNATYFSRVLADNAGRSPADWPGVVQTPLADYSHLSRDSREIMEMLFVGASAWSKGMERSQSNAGLVQAAFAIMKGQALPPDPVYGLPYQWDPLTRQLSAPDSPAFQEMQLKPVTVPRH